MKQVLFSVWILFTCYSFAHAAYLACDPPDQADQVTAAQLEWNSVWEPPFEVPGCTEKQVGCVWSDDTGKMHFIVRDLDGATDGQHTARLRFINIWGEGQISNPFVFNKSRPTKKQLRIIP